MSYVNCYLEFNRIAYAEFKDLGINVVAKLDTGQRRITHNVSL